MILAGLGILGIAVAVWLWMVVDAYRASGRGENPNLRDDEEL